MEIVKKMFKVSKIMLYLAQMWLFYGSFEIGRKFISFEF